MQPPVRPYDSGDMSAQPHWPKPDRADPFAVLRAYGAGVGVPSDRWKLDLQAQLVGAVVFALAGMCLLVTLVLVLATWLPAWLVTLGLTVALTSLGLGLFASVTRPAAGALQPNMPAMTQGMQGTSVPAVPQDVSAIEEIDPTEVESMRGQDLMTEAEADGERLTPHPIEAVNPERDSASDEAKTRPLGEPPPGPQRRQMRAQMPSGVSLNH